MAAVLVAVVVMSAVLVSAASAHRGAVPGTNEPVAQTAHRESPSGGVSFYPAIGAAIGAGALVIAGRRSRRARRNRTTVAST